MFESIDYTVSTKELVAVPEVAAAIKAGDVIVFDLVESKKNPDYVSAYFVGPVTYAGNDGRKLSRFALKALKFDQRVERAIQTFHKDEIEAEGITKGFRYDDVQIRIEDDLEPQTAGDWTQKPRQTSDGDALVSKDSGEEIYRTTELVFKDEFEDLGGHITIECMTESDYLKQSDTATSGSRITSDEVEN